MELLPTLLRVSQCDDPSAAFQTLADDLQAAASLRCCLQIGADDREVRRQWPDDAAISEDLLDTALHVLRPEVFRLGSEFPFDATRYTSCEMLAIPLRDRDRRLSTYVLIAPEDAFGEDLTPWEAFSDALRLVEQRYERIAAAEKQCGELRLRVEETEALHTLGLAANRTLDFAEVLNLVARFTRTLLGAQYVTVSTSVGGMITTAASIGLMNTARALEDYHLARAIIEAERPLRIGGEEANLQVESFPFHASEGMKSGLGIPLSLFGDTFGALVVGYRAEREIAARDTRLALTLASHAAVAISNATLHSRLGQHSQELQTAYDELNKATEAKERFFASINHELRNPLGAVTGYLSLVLKTPDSIPQPALGYLQRANQGATTLRYLVNDLLDLSKMAAGAMRVDFRPCALKDVVDQAMSTIQPLAEGKGVSLSGPPLDSLPVIITDGKRLEQILVNLLSNAVKFTEAGEIRLTIDSQQNGADAEELEFRVVDNGPGIPEDDLEKVFLEFEQVKGTVGGTGLGLPISRRLAGLLGGSLHAESTVGAGSTFILRLKSRPVAGAEAEAVMQNA